MGNRCLVCCASRNLRGSEVNYFTTELELLAIVGSLAKFRTFLVKSEVHIETDHKALWFLLSTRFLNDRLTRWTLAIQDYATKITYVPGTNNIAADALSRLSGRNNSKVGNEALIGILLTRKPSDKLRQEVKHFAVEQFKDVKWSKIISILQLESVYKDYSLLSGVLTKGEEEEKRIVLTKNIMCKLLLEAHELYGHIGSSKCIRMITEYFYFPNYKHMQLAYFVAATHAR